MLLTLLVYAIGQSLSPCKFLYDITLSIDELFRFLDI